MTREEILAMPAGRELDALVAEKVMVWKERVDFDYADGLIARYVPGTMDVVKFQPSTDISAAWEVVGKLRNNSLFLNIYMYTFGCITYISTSKGLALQEVKCDTAPEAICKAALLAAKEATP